MEPPWIKYPDIPAMSIGWRMGGGEDYGIAFYRWFRALTPSERQAYCAANPEPDDDWRGYYAGISPTPES